MVYAEFAKAAITWIPLTTVQSISPLLSKESESNFSAIISGKVIVEILDPDVFLPEAPIIRYQRTANSQCRSAVS